MLGKRRRRVSSFAHLASFAASVVAITVVAGCGGGSDQSGGTVAAGADDPGPVVINIGQLIPTLDPASACHVVDSEVTNTLYAQLTKYGTKDGPQGTLVEDTSKIEPYLAKSWEISDDGLTYTFALYPDLKFPSGRPVDSEAWKYSLERTIKVNGCGAYGLLDGLYDPLLIKRIDTPDPTTLVITLSQPDVNFLQNLAQWASVVVDPQLVEENGGVVENTPNEWLASHSAGYGPYLLESYEPNKKLVLVANPDFVIPAKEQKLIINLYDSDSALLLAAREGQADVTVMLSKQAAKTLEGNPCCKVVSYPVSAWDKIILPAKVPPFDNAKFREALTYAVPYDDLLNNVYYGYGEPFYGPWAPAVPWYNETIGAPREFDLDKAKSLIAESGLKTPIQFDLLTPEGNAIEAQIATIVQGIWKDIGVNVNVKTVTVEQQLEDAYSTHKNATLFYDSPGVYAPDYHWDYDMKCGSMFNSDQSCNPEADKLIAKLRSTTDEAERQDITDQAAEMWIEDSPRIQVMQDKFVVVLGNKIDHFEFYRTAHFRTIEK